MFLAISDLICCLFSSPLSLRCKLKQVISFLGSIIFFFFCTSFRVSQNLFAFSGWLHPKIGHLYWETTVRAFWGNNFLLVSRIQSTSLVSVPHRTYAHHYEGCRNTLSLVRKIFCPGTGDSPETSSIGPLLLQ